MKEKYGIRYDDCVKEARERAIKKYTSKEWREDIERLKEKIIEQDKQRNIGELMIQKQSIKPQG
ncbi:hypothetical protein VM1G_11610 [Cytospora mali]|uniref:Uncharacterized protein n=1 Tax=Cytospora mali TaxID=578113 RepID=A0A194VZX2_CYTMA|nr:hypothetical protein VM1G_11611 [Valsa mali]KUI69760.1 hypothetical protein VM1G_11610 [Valsa mali]